MRRYNREDPKMSLVATLNDALKKKILSGQAGMWVVIGVMIGITAGVGSLILYNMIRFISLFLLTGLTGYSHPLPGAEGGSGIYSLVVSRVFLIPVSTTLGGLISGYLVYKLSPGSEGLGINAAINAFHNLSVRIKNRTPAVKLVASAVVIGSGGSAGRDGPVALISAVFGSFISDRFHLDDHDRRIVMASAIGAGIGSIFMAPIGGAIMSTEILYKKDFEVEALIPATIASLVGYAIFGLQFHYVPLFTTAASSFLFTHFTSVLVYAIIGLAAGLGSRFYVKLFELVHALFIRLKRVPVYIKPAIGGLLVGIIAMFYPEVMGLGYGWVQLILSDNGNLGNLVHTSLYVLLLLFLLKILATSFTIGSGGSGGAFAPSIVTGAFLGASLGIILHGVFHYVTIDEMTIVTMIAFFAGVSKTPVSMLIMGTEMAGGLDLFLPLMIAVTISYFVSGARDSVYSAQVLNRLHSPAHIFEYRDKITEKIAVRNAMSTNSFTVSKTAKIGDLAYRMRVSGKTGAVVGDSVKLEGYITWNEINEHLGESDKEIQDIMDENPVTISVNENLKDAIAKLPQDTQKRIVVIDPQTKNIEGILGFEEIADSYEVAYRDYKTSQMMGS